MNTPALVTRSDPSSLPQWNGPSASAYGDTAGAGPSAGGTRLWSTVRKFWWIPVLAWLVLAVPASLYVWQSVKPGFVAVGAIRVTPVVSDVMKGDTTAMPLYSEFLRTQAELMTSSRVLVRAAEDPRLKNYDWFRTQPDQLAYLERMVNVSTGNNSQLITISVTHPDAQAATDMVNSVMDAYTRVVSEDEENATGKSLQILKQYRDHTETSLQEWQTQLAGLKADGASLSNEDDRRIMVGLLESSRALLAKLEADHLNMQALLTNVKSRPPPDEKQFKSSIGTEGDSQIEKWTAEKVRLQMLDNILASRGATVRHPDREEYRTQLKVLDEKIAQRTDELRQSRWTQYMAMTAVDRSREVARIQGEVQAMDQQLAAMRKRVEEQGKAAQTLSGKVQPIRTLEEQIAEAKDALRRYNERIQDLESKTAAPGRIAPGWSATMPRTAKVDRRAKYIAAANGGALLLGAAGLLLLSRLRNRIETSDDLPSTYQPLVVGTVSNAGPGTRGLQGRMRRKILGEEMRLVHANLLPPGRPQRRVFMITSPTPSNGKTSIAAHLALSLAKSGLEVLLIDGDLRKRDLTGMFDVGFRPGLAELLQGQTPELVRPVELLPNFRVMGAGAKLERNPVELLQRKHLKESLDLLQEKFDCIVIDTPPALVVADARLIAPSCDEVLCVVRSQISSPREVSDAVDALRRVKGASPKIIMNGVDQKQKYYKYKFAYADKSAGDTAAQTQAAMHDQFD